MSFGDLPRMTTAPVSRAVASAWTFPRKLSLTLACVVVLWLVWRLSGVIVLAFGGIVFAVALHRLALGLRRLLPVSERLGVVLAVLLVLGALAAVGYTVGDAIGTQLSELRERLPRALEAFSDWLGRSGSGRWLLDLFTGIDLPVKEGARRIASLTLITFGGLGAAALMFVLAAWLAARPEIYLHGALRLAPPRHRGRLADAACASADGLARWLGGQAIAMLFLGAGTALGLSLLGIPMALGLGVITGLFAFVPFIGAITAGVLSVLFAFAEGPQTALYVAILFLAIQQIEDYVVYPLVQGWTRALPPVLTLAAAGIFGTLFGVIGVIFAAPLMVVVMTLIEKLYIEDLLEAGDSLALPQGP